MIAALFLLFWNVYFIVFLLPWRKVVVIGPQHPNGSIAKGSKIICLFSNFFRSKLCRCLLAKAEREGIASSESSNEEVCARL